MQKILLILISMFIGTAHATEMCAKNNTIVIPLDATVAAESGKTGYDAIEWMWWAQFPYGKIYGYGTHLSLQEVREIENNPDLTSFPSVLNTDSDELIGRSGTDANGNTRDKFYYKLAHPMSSNWVHRGNGLPALANLVYQITLYAEGAGIRALMFNSIGASMAEKEPETDTE